MITKNLVLQESTVKVSVKNKRHIIDYKINNVCSARGARNVNMAKDTATN